MGAALRVGEERAAGSGWGGRAGWAACRGGREHLITVASTASASADAATNARLAVDRALATFELLEGLAPARRLGHCMRAASDALGAAEPAEDWEIGLNLMAIDADGVTFAGTGEGLLALIRSDGRVVIGRRRSRQASEKAGGYWTGLRAGRPLESWTIDRHQVKSTLDGDAAVAATGGAAALSDVELTIGWWTGRRTAERTARELVELYDAKKAGEATAERVVVATRDPGKPRRPRTGGPTVACRR